MPKADPAAEKPITEQDKTRAIDAHKSTLKAAERMARIMRARGDYMSFVHLMMPDPADPEDVSLSRYQEAYFHTLMAEQLMKVEKGLARRTIFTLPPGHGKSELAAKKFIPWFEGKDPYRNVIFSGYSGDFAAGTGSAVRGTMKSPMYRQVFPGCSLAVGSASVSHLKTNEGGELIFAGASGQITGKRAHLLVIDDPIKNREEANNPLLRQKLWEFFQDTASSRMADFMSSIIIIMTRWHDDDLVGRLIDPANDFYNPEQAKQWEVFEIPALAEENDKFGRKPGEALWPEKFNREYLELARSSNPTGFSALYQGRPAPEDGDFFKASWIKTYIPEDLPENLRMYCCSDHAVSIKQTRDSTVLLPFGVDSNDNIWIMPDVWWHRRETPEVVEAMLSLMRKYKPLIWSAESGHISKAIGPFLKKRMHETRTYTSLQELVPAKDKMTRAQSIQGRMSMGKVYFPRFATWLPNARSEILKFPSAKHDDFVDTIAWAGITLGQQVGAAVDEQNDIDKEPMAGTMSWIKHSDDYLKRQRAKQNDGY